MKDKETQNLIESIRKGEIDINNQSLFFPIVIKGLIVKLNEQITIRGKKIPHYILHTGDDTMYLSVKGQDASIEPLEVSNENFVYSSVPRCLVNVKGMNLETDQLTSPYVHGVMQYESTDKLYTLTGEFRRIPLTLSVECAYYTDSWGDMMELTQQIISKLAFIQTYNVSYMGQKIICSYVIPTSLEGEYTAEMDGTTQDNKLRTMNISLEIETNFPVWEHRTIIPSNWVINYTSGAGLDGARTQAALVKRESYPDGPIADTEILQDGKEYIVYNYRDPDIENPSSKITT